MSLFSQDNSASSQQNAAQTDNSTSPAGNQQDDSHPNNTQGRVNPQTEPSLEELKIALTTAQKDLENMTTIAQRTMADLQNFKRHTDEDRNNLTLFANFHFLQAIFPVIDNFQRAFQHIPENLINEEWIKGIFAMEKQFISTLTNLGLQEIPCEPGSKFDPNLHEAISQCPGEKDLILQCFEKGYLFKNQVIRPSKIMVGSGEAPPPPMAK
ncbi:MAG: GrpE protein, molecular chaperone GrpE [Candidatus Peregrinibacteria bacterium GW2011_GWF2_39_17]|nr:MAG: GrpE protein, molecular chaperone GrpE [Candidatus Peregrinibacteria bacterium GW2011_GWF2_39_17]